MSDRRSGRPAAEQSSAPQALAAGTLASDSEAARRRARLIRTIEGEIIPRLLVSLSGSLVTAREARHFLATPEFARLLLAAGLLGEIWDRDEYNFAQLKAGLNLLEAVIHQVGEPAQSDSR